MDQDLTFYSTAATILPVLFLALAFQATGPSAPHHPATSRWISLGLFTVGAGFLALGEVAALRVLDQGEATTGAHDMVRAAMWIGGLLVFINVAQDRARQAPQPFVAIALSLTFVSVVFVLCLFVAAGTIGD